MISETSDDCTSVDTKDRWDRTRPAFRIFSTSYQNNMF